MLKNTARVAGSLAVVFALASCGGGGDIAGDSTDFSVSPDEWTRTVIADANGGCSAAAGSSAVVFTIIGGQAPFRIVNASPGGLIVDKTEATGKDPKFTVRPTGACGDPFVITVLDYHSRVATVEVTIEAEDPDEEEEPAAAQ